MLLLLLFLFYRCRVHVVLHWLHLLVVSTLTQTHARTRTNTHTHTSASTPQYIARIQLCVIYTARTLSSLPLLLLLLLLLLFSCSFLAIALSYTNFACDVNGAGALLSSLFLHITHSLTHTHIHIYTYNYKCIDAVYRERDRQRQRQSPSECLSALFVLPLPASTGDLAQPHARNVEQQLNSHCAVRRPRCRRCHSGCCAQLRTIHKLECVVKSRSIWMPFAKNSFISVALGQRQPTACESQSMYVCLCVLV